MQATALLAGEAVADTEILITVLKGITGRQRPADVPPGGIIPIPGAIAMVRS